MSRAWCRAAAALIAAGTAVVVAVPVAPGAAATPAPPLDGNLYTTVTPQRVLDSRLTGGAFGPGVTRPLDLPGTAVPADAVAVVLNLTATAPTAPGHPTVYPADTSRPVASSLNERAGETRSNSVTVALPCAGSRVLDVHNQAGSTDVVVDLEGWYAPDGASGYYSAVTPERVLSLATTAVWTCGQHAVVAVVARLSGRGAARAGR